MAATKLKAPHKVYSTATPMDTPGGSAYFISQVTNLPVKQVYTMLGFNVESVRNPYTGEYEMKLTIGKGVNPQIIKQNILHIRDKMIAEGTMLRREYPFYGDVREQQASMTPEQREEQGSIHDYWDEQEANAMDDNGNVPPKLLMSLRGQRSGELSRWNELNKVDLVFNDAMEDIRDGRRVVIIAEGINPTFIKGLNREIPGFIQTIEKMFEDAGVKTAKIYGDFDKAAANRDFQKGDVQVVIGTPKSAATGIDLDDQIGGHPRTLYMATPNYSGNMFDQILGRVSRRNTKTPATVKLVFNNSDSDLRRREIVKNKLGTLKAITEGRIIDDIDLTGVAAEPDAAAFGDQTTAEPQTGEKYKYLRISEKAFVVKGDTEPIKGVLKKLGAKWHNLHRGWMFPNYKLQAVKNAIEPSLQKTEAPTVTPPVAPEGATMPDGLNEKVHAAMRNFGAKLTKEGGKIITLEKRGEMLVVGYKLKGDPEHFALRKMTIDKDGMPIAAELGQPETKPKEPQQPQPTIDFDKMTGGIYDKGDGNLLIKYRDGTEVTINAAEYDRQFAAYKDRTEGKITVWGGRKVNLIHYDKDADVAGWDTIFTGVPKNLLDEKIFDIIVNDIRDWDNVRVIEKNDGTINLQVYRPKNIEPNPLPEIQKETPEEQLDEPTIEREVAELDDPEDKPEGAPLTESEAKEEKKDFAEAEEIISKAGPIKDFGEKIGGARKDLAESGFTMSGGKGKGTKEPAWMKGFSIPFENGKYRPIKTSGNWIIWRSKDSFDTEQEAYNRIKLAVITSKFKIGKVGPKEDESYHVYRKVADRKRYSLKGGFANEVDAMKWIIENQEMLLNYKPSFPVRPHIENIERTGKAYRENNRNVTTEEFRDKFGFSGGEFGNWIPQDERQRILNMAYDGLMDLADVLGVPPKALSLNGQLSIAFGARGHGLSGASAHYERGRAVFNLTRMKGAGSVAHEWFHALDHYLGRGAEGLPNMGKLPGAVFEKVGIMFSETVSYRQKGWREEVKKAFNEMLDGIFKQPKIIEVSVEHYGKVVERYQDSLKYELQNVRNWLTRGREYGRKRPPATEAQLKQVDDLIAKILNGDYGEPVKYETKEKGWKGMTMTRDTFSNIQALDEIAKKVMGRSFLTKDSSLNKASSYARFVRDSKAQLEKYKIDNKEERSTPTSFYYGAKELDMRRTKDYWTTNPEMAARAFEAFVEDQINNRGNISQYLVHSTDNINYFDPFTGTKDKPYPEGDERVKFNELFKNFFDVLNTAENEGGRVAFFKAARMPVKEVELMKQIASTENEIARLNRAKTTFLKDVEKRKKQELLDKINVQGDLFGGEMLKPRIKEGEAFDVRLDTSEANINRVLTDFDNQIIGAETNLQLLRNQLETARRENQQGSLWDDPSSKFKFVPGEFVGEQLNAMKEHEYMRRAKVMTEYTGVPVVVIRTKAEMPDYVKRQAIKTWGNIENVRIPAVYDVVGKQVYIILEDTRSISEMVSNMSHEIFAHHGLKALLQGKYADVMNLVYRGMSPVDKARIAEEYNTDENDWETISEEYLGEMSENPNLNPTLWQRIIAKIRELIRKVFNIAMSKAEVINLLRRSRENLTKNRPNPKDFTNVGEYLDALKAYTGKMEKASGQYGYGMEVAETRKLGESLAKGNMDYRAYFEIAKDQIGRKAAELIERAMSRNNLDIEKTLNYLEAKMVQNSDSPKYLKMAKLARGYLANNPPKTPDALYQVLIGKGKAPDELNFLTWDKPPDNLQKEAIINQLDAEGKYDVTFVGAFRSGESIYKRLSELFGSDREASLFLSRAGVDGMIHVDRGNGISGPLEMNKRIVVYDNTPVDVLEQIRFKKAKKQAFVGEHLKRAGENYLEKPKTKRNWEETIRGVREYIQDMNLPVRMFEEEVLKRGGIQPNEAKPYRDIFNAFGRQETLYKDYVREKMKPVLRNIADIIREGMPGEDVLPYIISKHALERNPVMRAEELQQFINKDKKNPPSPEEIQEFMESIEDKDYSGVMSFDADADGNPLGNFVNPEELAKSIVDEFEAVVPKERIKELWDNMRTASSEILDIWEKGLQISKEKKQEYLDRFKYFVPLRGWREGAAKELVYTKGEGFRKSLVHAKGRKSLADNPLAYMQQVAFSAIGELVDMEVKKAMFNLLMKNIQRADLYDLATFKKMYYEKVTLPDGTVEWEPTTVRPAPEKFESGDAETRIYNEHQRLRKPKLASQHEVILHREGGDVVMVFKGKMLPVAHALNKRNFMYRNLFGNIKDQSIMNQAFAGMAAVNNFLKAAYTTWNVVFPFTNFMRDAQESSITQFIRGDNGFGVVKNYTRAFPAILSFLMGKLDMNNPDHVHLRDFYLIGGSTGFTHMKTPEQIEKGLMAEVERMVGRGTIKGEFKHYANEAVEVISMWNQLFEDATRFSVYLTSIELGYSKEDAAAMAKEASVNFNRKGKSSAMYDAVYAFWNVSWQSLQKNMKLGKDYPRRFAYVASAFMAVGFLEAMFNKMTDDEDPENNYYNINPWMRENYLILPNIPRLIAGESKGNKYLSIPLPQFWRGFKSIGSLAFDVMIGEMKPGEAISKAFLNFAGAMAPIDIGGFGKTGEFSFAPLVPTIFKPFYEVATNRNYMGYTIAKEPFDKTQKKLLANAGLGKENVSPAAKFFTDMIFGWFGGDNATKFYTDKNGVERKVFSEYLPQGITNPSMLEHLFKGYTGGTGAAFSDLVTTISQALSEDQEVNFKNIPFINRFIRQTPESKWKIISDYYNLKDVVTTHKALKREYTKKAEEGGSSAQIAATEGSDYYQTYQDIFETYDKDIQELTDTVNFTNFEGTEEIYKLMQNCINDIKALKKQYNMK